mmetsp:Transcript_744/g.986  ORF Transcript_744/g.986 Transcript_744/m.986 type:complete len:217 (+) Transcript_744:1632-2282(+)
MQDPVMTWKPMYLHGSNGLQQGCFPNAVFAHETIAPLIGKFELRIIQYRSTRIQRQRNIAHLNIPLVSPHAVIRQHHGRDSSLALLRLLRRHSRSSRLELSPRLLQLLPLLAPVFGRHSIPMRLPLCIRLLVRFAVCAPQESLCVGLRVCLRGERGRHAHYSLFQLAHADVAIFVSVRVVCGWLGGASTTAVFARCRLFDSIARLFQHLLTTAKAL